MEEWGDFAFPSSGILCCLDVTHHIINNREAAHSRVEHSEGGEKGPRNPRQPGSLGDGREVYAGSWALEKSLRERVNNRARWVPGSRREDRPQLDGTGTLEPQSDPQ